MHQCYGRQRLKFGSAFRESLYKRSEDSLYLLTIVMDTDHWLVRTLDQSIPNVFAFEHCQDCVCNCRATPDLVLNRIAADVRCHDKAIMAE